MDLIAMYEDSITDPSEQLLSPESIDVDDIFGDPEILPRLGDQYQAKIPSLVPEHNRFQIIEMPADREVMTEVAYSFVIGLPIPVTWIHDCVKHETMEFHDHSNIISDANGAENSENSKENLIISNGEDSNLKVEAVDVAPDGKGSGQSTNGEYAVTGFQMAGEVPLGQTEQPNLDQYTDKSYRPVPGSLERSWSNMEQESFLLSLYIFGKNLVQVKKFVENKDTGDILSYYYGKFYRSDGYHRWSECRKLRSRRSIHGHKIFTGWRQQELLSRLLPRVSDDCQNTLLQVSKSFGEGKTSLEEYISTLKATVGMKALIEAVGIGKGKQDLTGIMEPVRTNQVIPIRQEIPTGKECNSLTSADIIKFLTGDFRLSKARSNDLFWEAVWPRLLARGWHSEQPKNHCYVASKHSLVFLVPGVKKFSRRRLVKGNHYFDSVSDVLNKVALDPRLIEVNVEAPRGSSSKEEYEQGMEVKLDQDGSPDTQHQCYLRPRTSSCNSELMKFTVVDTSLAQEGPYKVRELRTLPVDIINTSTPSLSRETDRGSSEELMDELDSGNMLLNDQGDTNISRSPNDLFDRKLCTNTSDNLANISKQEIKVNGPVIVDVPMDNHKDQHANKSNGKHPRNAKRNRRIKPHQSNYMAPMTKRRRLTACAHAEKSSMDNFSAVLQIKEENSSCRLDSTDASTNTVFEVETSQEKVPASSSAKVSSGDNSDEIPSANCVLTECSDEKAEPRTLIDLNLPHDPQDFEISEPLITEMTGIRDDSSEKGSSFPSETNQPQDSQVTGTSNSVAGLEQQPVMNARRHSTRNRPLTTRALEALECGFFNAKRRRKGPENLLQDSSIPRASRRARGRVGTITNLDAVVTGILDPKADVLVDEECSSSTNVVIGYQVCSERKGNHELVSLPQPTFHTEILAGKDN